MGELNASGIVLEPEHALPPGIDIVSAMATSGFLSGGIWQLNLPTGESATLTLTLKAGPTEAPTRYCRLAESNSTQSWAMETRISRHPSAGWHLIHKKSVISEHFHPFLKPV